MNPPSKPWLPALVAGIALLAATVSLARFTPPWPVWRALGIPEAAADPALNRAADALRQLERPFAFDVAPNNRVIEWRLAFPLLGHVLGLPGPAYLALAHLGCLAVLAFAAGLLLDAGLGVAAALAGTILLATCSWFFVSTGWLGYFDSWYVLGLLAAAFAPRRWAVAAVLVAPWVDERFILALPLALVLRDRFLLLSGGDRSSAARRREARMLAAAALPWLAVRLVAHLAGHDPVTRAYVHGLRPDRNWPHYGLGLWQGLRWGWFLVAGWLTLEWRVGGVRGFAWRAVVFAAVIGANLAIADDLSRSMSVAVPAAVAGILWLRRRGRAQMLLFLGLLALLNLGLGAEHVVADWTYPLAPFWKEDALAAHPPPLLDPAAYTEQAGLLNGRGDYAGALAELGSALQLGPDYAPAHSNRAFSLYRLGRADEAMAEADRAIALDPHFFAAWYNRGLMRAARGDLRGAAGDIDRAVREAPADWPQRPQAEAAAWSLRARAGL